MSECRRYSHEAYGANDDHSGGNDTVNKNKFAREMYAEILYVIGVRAR